MAARTRIAQVISTTRGISRGDKAAILNVSLWPLNVSPAGLALLLQREGAIPGGEGVLQVQERGLAGVVSLPPCLSCSLFGGPFARCCTSAPIRSLSTATAWQLLLPCRMTPTLGPASAAYLSFCICLTVVPCLHRGVASIC